MTKGHIAQLSEMAKMWWEVVFMHPKWYPWSFRKTKIKIKSRCIYLNDQKCDRSWFLYILNVAGVNKLKTKLLYDSEIASGQSKWPTVDILLKNTTPPKRIRFIRWGYSGWVVAQTKISRKPPCSGESTISVHCSCGVLPFCWERQCNAAYM